MIIKGRVHKFGNNINTDDIIAAKYLTSFDPVELGRHCMETIAPNFVQKVSKGDIIVAGRNFGCGSSREHAPLAIKGSGISCVIAQSFARIFYRNAINVGLPILELKQSSLLKEGLSIQIDLDKGQISTQDNKRLTVEVFPLFLQDIIKSKGLLNWITTKRRKS